MTAQLEMKKSFTPLSIVIISNFSHLSLKKCLDSILANDNQDKIEIIVPHYCSDEIVSNLVENYSGIHFLQFKEKAGIPVLSAAGIAQSSGEIIALTDSSCVVDSGWITSILKAHQSLSPVIGGAVECHGQMTLLDWAAYFCEYGQFMFPLKSGVAEVLPGNNISFKRSVLSVGNEYVKNEFWKTFWCQKLQAKGIELTQEPSILVYYTKVFKLIPFLRRRFHHGCCFAGMRAKRMTLSKRALYVAGSIFLPIVFLYRTIAVVFNKKRLLKELLLSFPYIVLAVVLWSLGEVCGYLAGAKKSCDYIY